jgi:hypothetical protein
LPNDPLRTIAKELAARTKEARGVKGRAGTKVGAGWWDGVWSGEVRVEGVATGMAEVELAAAAAAERRDKIEPRCAESDTAAAAAVAEA